MGALEVVVGLFPQTLAIINDAASALAVVTDKEDTSSNLNYIIGGLIIIVLILVGNTLFGKKKA